MDNNKSKIATLSIDAVDKTTFTTIWRYFVFYIISTIKYRMSSREVIHLSACSSRVFGVSKSILIPRILMFMFGFS